MGGFRGCSVALMIIDCNHPKDSLDEVFFFFFFLLARTKEKKKEHVLEGKKKVAVSLRQGQGEVKNVQIQSFAGGKALSPFSFSLTSYLRFIWGGGQSSC